MTSRIERFAEALGSRYEVERELGTGGTATVYLAKDLKYQRRVAVKVFRPEVAEAMGHERFVREIAFVATLNHPHIVPLLDSGEAEELLYYVMPAVEGESLRDRLAREGTLPVDEAIQIARDVAVALDYAHKRNVVHRDIKPENILLTAGTSVVADFGIAKMVNSGSKGNSLTRAGIAVGTVAYMSPEQASAGQVDGRSDIYSLGCVLFEMLAGRPPFVGKSTRLVVAAHFTEAVPSVHALRAEVASTLDVVLARAMAKAPEDRFETATAFIDELIAARKAASRERMWQQMGTEDAKAILERSARANTPVAPATPGKGATVQLPVEPSPPAPSPTPAPSTSTLWVAIAAVVVALVAVSLLFMR
ncbi:MAG: serine/threonine protein kinase [Gemmatimonadetes bacterium]|nr:serine/threonine protein kinase [Gemmatimonadota bacterium]